MQEAPEKKETAKETTWYTATPERITRISAKRTSFLYILPKQGGVPPIINIYDEIKKGRHTADLLLFHGGAEGDRTPDPKTASLVLSQLSYSPMANVLCDKEINVTSHALVVKKKCRRKSSYGPVDSTSAIGYTRPMKKLLIFAVLCLAPVSLFAHPGKTDRHGGHKCVKGCEEWGLYYAEYHLHDKYGKPIRIGSRMKAAMPSEVKSAASETAPPITSIQTVTVYRTVTTVQEENIAASNPLLWVLIALLLLFLILRRTRRQPQKS